ncbi:hypothetical protein [Ohtaekwangia koreensis]|uniref:Uncharacterized protein n=1 Tax=Ohtaekwangia koreensis TaxID=688867 RepID=A0A1T5M8N3_9BACT|nr:hypothetical protein [Ohtaekwangia koreensis]SKC84374.1 hypothetical protein SAMN05660236_4760 [Ohtaekwangia koreensis]
MEDSMKSVLEKLKLIDHLTTELPIEKYEFVEKLRRNVDQGDTGVFLSPFEAFSSSKNEYKGTVTFDSFKIRRRRRFFDMAMNLAVAEGSFRQRENLLIIESTIKGFRSVFILFIGFMFLVYTGIIASFVSSDTPGDPGWFFVPFIFIHAAIMFGIPYFVMRRGVARMKYELERDFFYMTK